MERVRALAHDLVETLSDEEVRLLIAYAHQLQEGHFAALTQGLEQEWLGGAGRPPPPAGPRPPGGPSSLPSPPSPAGARSTVSASPWRATPTSSSPPRACSA